VIAPHAFNLPMVWLLRIAIRSNPKVPIHASAARNGLLELATRKNPVRFIGGGTGVCYFLDSSTDHLANSASQSIQGDAVGSSGPDFYADLRVNEYGSWEASTGTTPGTYQGTFRALPGTFIGLTACSPGLEGTTAAVTDL
jgi:hypothetical protein